MGLSMAEQETTISFSRDSDVCWIYTSDSTEMTRLDKLVKKTKYWKLRKEHRSKGEHELVGKTYETNKNLICFRSGFKVLTEDQLAEMAERAKKNFHGQAGEEGKTAKADKDPEAVESKRLPDGLMKGDK